MSYKKSVITRNHIIDTAIDLIYEKGIDKVSLNKILEVAQVSKGSFYHQFNNLDDLMHDVFRKIATYFFGDFALSGSKMTQKTMKEIGRKLIYSDENQDKISSVLLILLSRSFTDASLKKELIDFREKSIKEKDNVKVDDDFIMLFDILVIGFLAQSQVIREKESLVTLWDTLVDRFLVN